MKTALITLVAFFAAFYCMAGILTWTYPAPYLFDTNAQFAIQESANLTNWTTLGLFSVSSGSNSIVGTNALFSFPVTNTAPAFFRLITSSPYWGNALTSNIAYVPPGTSLFIAP
jgi:hypothetical protein